MSLHLFRNVVVSGGFMPLGSGLLGFLDPGGMAAGSCTLPVRSCEGGRTGGSAAPSGGSAACPAGLGMGSFSAGRAGALGFGVGADLELVAVGRPPLVSAVVCRSHGLGLGLTGDLLRSRSRLDDFIEDGGGELDLMDVRDLGRLGFPMVCRVFITGGGPWVWDPCSSFFPG
jgi:hypothetical protein